MFFLRNTVTFVKIDSSFEYLEYSIRLNGRTQLQNEEVTENDIYISRFRLTSGKCLSPTNIVFNLNMKIISQAFSLRSRISLNLNT